MYRILILDNHDSFTYNLVEVLRQTHDCHTQVILIDDWAAVQVSHFQGVIISPGPGLPGENVQLLKAIEHFKGKIPLLGVCLGHQALAMHFGAALTQLKTIKHGESSQIYLDTSNFLYKGLPSVIEVGRYHSWAVSKEGFPESLQITSATKDGIIMSFSHKTLAISGVQFHPESILTPLGKQILTNWIHQCPLKKYKNKDANI